MGFGWDQVQKINPRMIYASIKGFGAGPYEDCKVYENVAQCTGGAASTTGFRDGPPLVTGAQIGRSEEHTSELQSLMRISYAVFCLKKKKTRTKTRHIIMIDKYRTTLE